MTTIARTPDKLKLDTKLRIDDLCIVILSFVNSILVFTTETVGRVSPDTLPCNKGRVTGLGFFIGGF